jgi:serine/threonine protein kinase/Tol biopolymer transport system component
MTPERWAQVNEVLGRSLQVAPEKRAAFLYGACGPDESLRREVESLLAADDQARSSFLQSPPVGLAKGTRLGEYEVISKLGAGGMGEVYRALDVRLRREVAIKILPGFASSDPERLRRFEQEAMAAAALNHPNILAVYQMGTHEGGPYLVSELLEGETLRELIKRGRIALHKAIDYGVQIAHGLAAAHEKGIVHRDLKPENLFVTKDGRAKILDFGLAKLQQPQSSSVHSALTVGGETEPGMVMGTVGYMSPEQVRGQTADHRADIFAFGAILYEMLMGQRAFQKPTSAETMAAILNEEPPPISQIDLQIPPALQRGVRRCLEKNPEQRFQSASDLAFVLGSLSDSDNASSAAVERAHRALFRKPRLIKLALASLLAVVLAMAGFFGLRHRSTTQSLKPKGLEITLLTHTGNAVAAAISPDARYVAYAFSRGDKASLIVRQVSTGSEVEIVPPTSTIYGSLTFSPDGNYIYIVQADPNNSAYAALYRIPTLGGRPVRLIGDIDSAVAFSPDGRQMAYIRGVLERNECQLLVAAADGSGEKLLLKQPVVLGSPHHGPNLFGPTWSPDGKFVVFTAYDPKSSARSVLRAVSIADGSVRDIYSSSDDMGRPLWLPDGSGFIVPISEHARNERAQLWYIPYPRGEPNRIIDDLNDYEIDTPSLSSDGKALVLVEKNASTDLWVAPAGDTSQAEPVTSNGFAERLFSWTPDDNILFADRDGNLFRMNREGSQRVLLNPDQQRSWAPSACGDGHIVFESYRNQKVGLWIMDLDGSNPAPLATPPYAEIPQCSTDGSWIVYQIALNAFCLRLGGQETQRMIGSGNAWSPRISPDGKLLAYVAVFQDTSKPPRLQIASFPDGRVVHEFPWEASTQRDPHWTPDSKAIQHAVPRNGAYNIWEQKLTGGPEKQITHFKSGRIFNFEWSPDGRYLAMTRGSLTREVTMIRNFR